MSSAVVELPTPRTAAIFLIATDWGDDPASAIVLEAGLQLAREAGARVVLYDRAAESSFVDPFEAPTWAGGHIPKLASASRALPAAAAGLWLPGRAAGLANGMGLDAKAWLPFGTGPVAMARCAVAWG
jgi:hypothetical protein